MIRALYRKSIIIHAQNSSALSRAGCAASDHLIWMPII